MLIEIREVSNPPVRKLECWRCAGESRVKSIYIDVIECIWCFSFGQCLALLYGNDTILPNSAPSGSLRTYNGVFTIERA